MIIKKLFGLGAIVLISTSVMLCGCTEKVAENIPASSEISGAEAKHSIDVFGIVKAKNKDVINPNFTATVKKVYVSQGQRVKKGDVLCDLNINDYKLQIENKKSSLTSSNIEITKLNNSKQMEESDLSDMRNERSKKNAELTEKSEVELNKAENELNIAKKKYQSLQNDYNTKENLANKNAVAQKELQDAKAALEEGELSINNASLNLRNIKSNKEKEITELTSKIKQKEQSVLNYNSLIEDQKNKIDIMKKEITQMDSYINMSYIKDEKVVCCLNNGIISDMNYAEGEKISDEKPLCVIMDADSMYIKSDVPEEFIKDIKIGNIVSIVPVVDKSKKISGKVSKIYDMADRTNGETNIPIEITIDEGMDSLMLNSNVDIKIEAQK